MAKGPQLDRLSPAEKRLWLGQLLQEKAKQRLVFPLSHGQRGLWVLNQMDASSAACNIHFPSRIRSPLDIPALARSLQSLVDRHPSLRTTFESRAGLPVQRVHETMAVTLDRIDASSWSEKQLHQRLQMEVHRPFDLEQGPLLRNQLFTRAENDHLLLTTAHHIVLDFWSLIVLLKEIRDTYPAECAGHTQPPAPKSSDYADFVRWQADLLASPRGQRLRSYWNQHLDGAGHVLELATDQPRPPSFTYRAGGVSCSISADLTRQLAALAVEQKATLYTILLATLQVLLGRYSGQDDFLIGSPFSGRSGPGFENTVGCFINMLPMRADLSGDPTFRELLVKLRDHVFDALENQDYPFSLLVEQIQAQRDLSRPPLVQVSLTLEKSQWQGEVGRGRFLFPDADACIDVAGILGETYYVEQKTCQLDLEWVFEQADDTIHGMIRYCADLFDQQTMRRMVQHYQTLLASAAANPDRPISELAWFSEAERGVVIHDWNQTRVDFPTDACLHHGFEQQARETPAAVAVRFGKRSIRYAELDSLANRLAHQLCRLGVGPGALVALCFERSPEMVVAILATLKAGGAYVPLDPKSPTERLRLQLEDTSPRVLLCQHDLCPRMPQGTCAIIGLDHSDAQPRGCDQVSGPPASDVRPSDLAYVVYTSGSTGQPKGVMVEHRAISNTIHWHHKEFARGPKDRVLLVLPFFFDASISTIFSTLTSGAELVLPAPGEELNPALLVERIARERLSVLTIPPRLLEVLLDHPKIDECRHVRLAFTGGEVMSPELPARVHALLGVPLHNLYGPTEAAVEATYWTCQPDDTRSSNRIGRPIANTRAYVLDPNRQPQPIGVPGELYIGGAGVARGYWNAPELTATHFLADPFDEDSAARMYRTGDRCRWLHDGSLEFLGRLDDQVKLRGQRIEPGEIEHALKSLKAVREAAVAVHNDRANEPQLVAYVVPSDPRHPPDIEELRHHLQGQLPASMVPAIFTPRASLPRTASGKLDRRALPAPQFDRTLNPRSYVAPRTALEQFLTELWGEILHVERLGIEDTFYELGGSSIQGAILVARLQEKLGRPIRLAALFEMPNIAALAHYLAKSYPEAVAGRFGVESLADAVRSAPTDKNTQHGGSAAVAAAPQPADVLVALQPEGHRPPLFMVHPPGGIVLCYQPMAQQFGREQPLYGIRGRGLHGDERLPDTLESMAAEYTAAIRTVQPKGPYFLGGWSLGGVVTYEMAQQFLAQGESVGLLALLDTTIPHGEANAQYRGDQDRSGLEYGLDITLGELAKLNPDQQLPYLWNHARKLGVIEEDAPADVVEQVLDDLKRIFHAHVRMATEYALRPYPGAITLFRPQHAPVEVPTPRDRGWGRLGRSVDVHFVPGQHHTMVKEPNIQVLATRLRGCIPRAE